MSNQITFSAWTWNEVLKWYLDLPVYAQLLCILAVFALITLVVVLVYYILKGTAYLVYYILKGTIYLVAALFYAIYKFFEGLYYLFSGKEKPLKQKRFFLFSKNKENHSESANEVAEVPKKLNQRVQSEVKFCSACGLKISDSMLEQLATNMVTFCPHCGKGYKAEITETES